MSLKDWADKMQPGTISLESKIYTGCENRFAVYRGSPIWCCHNTESYISKFPCEARVKNGTCPEGFCWVV